jgi:hypothetical protein
MPNFETSITSDGNLTVEGGLYAGATASTSYDLEIKGAAKLNSIANATSDTDEFLVSDGGEIKYRTGAEVAADIGLSGYLPLSGGTMTGDTNHGDNVKDVYGAGSDLEIYSDGTDGVITAGVDDLKISAADDVVIRVQGSENAVNCVGNGKVSLYYNNSEMWETLSDGAGTDGDIIETISNGGSKRIGFNVGDSFTENSETIAHYGISNAGNDAADGGIVLSGYFGLKFATNGNIRARIMNTGDTALLSHTLIAGFDENNSSTSYYYIPFNSISEGTSNQYYRNFACPNSGRVVSIMMMHTSGTAVSLNTYTTQLRVIKNGSTAATSGELTASDGNNDGSYIEYTPDLDFNKGDRLGFQFSKSNSIARWRGTSVTIMLEIDDYNLT